MKPNVPLLCLLSASLALSSCETPGQTALLGAGIGAVSGYHPLRNAAIGAGAGYLVGKIAQIHRREDGYYEDEGVRVRHTGGRYPYARLTERRGFVISPSSGNVIDVRGIPPGARVVDPSTDRIFVNP